MRFIVSEELFNSKFLEQILLNRSLSNLFLIKLEWYLLFTLEYLPLIIRNTNGI